MTTRTRASFWFAVITVCALTWGAFLYFVVPKP